MLPITYNFQRKTGIPMASYENLEKENKILKEKCTNLEKINEYNSVILQRIQEDISEINNNCAYQRLVLEKLVEKLLPTQINLNILPFENIEQLKNADIHLSTHSQRDLISYVQSIVGNTSIRKSFHFIFKKEAVLHANWDGRQNKFAVNKFKFFTEVIFFAVNGPEMSFETYEKEMKAGFRSYKKRHYRNVLMEKITKALQAKH